MYTLIFTAALLIIIDKTWKQPKCDIYKILFSKKKEILPFAPTWMDLVNIMLNEISQTEKENYRIIHLYVE